MEEQSNFEIKNKITPTGHEFEAKAKVPQEAVTELVLATTRCIDSIRKGSERVGAMLSNSTKAIGKPIGAYLKSKSNEISANSQLIVANIMYKKEINAIKHLQYISEELNLKITKGEDIPEKIEESDNLLLIQDNASTTSNEEFLKLWAKFYTEEACKPGVVSRKTIKTMETLDSNIIKIIERDIFPFCDEEGFFWGNDTRLQSLILAQDYGIISNKGLERIGMNTRMMLHVKLNNENYLYIHPSYSYSPNSRFILTKSGLEMKKVLKIYPNKEQLKEMLAMIEESSKNWQIAKLHAEKAFLKPNILNLQKYIIIDSANNVIYPNNQSYKTLNEYYQNAINNFEVLHV